CAREYSTGWGFDYW
nr:immunoglobulin heavy chain junction region [Macaca mulatta]